MTPGWFNVVMIFSTLAMFLRTVQLRDELAHRRALLRQAYGQET